MKVYQNKLASTPFKNSFSKINTSFLFQAVFWFLIFLILISLGFFYS